MQKRELTPLPEKSLQQVNIIPTLVSADVREEIQVYVMCKLRAVEKATSRFTALWVNVQM